jgi:hypothetical protein
MRSRLRYTLAMVSASLRIWYSPCTIEARVSSQCRSTVAQLSPATSQITSSMRRAMRVISTSSVSRALSR